MSKNIETPKKLILKKISKLFLKWKNKQTLKRLKKNCV